MAHRLAVPGQAGRAVGQVAPVLLLADREAEVRQRAAAVDALAALRREQRHDVVADRERVDALAERLDDARALVAEHRRRVARRVDARGRVEVGVADPAGDQAHQHLARARLGEVDVLDDERPAELLEHRGPDPHRQILVGQPARAARSLRSAARRRRRRRSRARSPGGSRRSRSARRRRRCRPTSR